MSDYEDTERASRWQPVMLSLRGGGRVECQCGALAVVIVGTLAAGDHLLDEVGQWCQSCYLNAQQEEG